MPVGLAAHGTTAHEFQIVMHKVPPATARSSSQRPSQQSMQRRRLRHFNHLLMPAGTTCKLASRPCFRSAQSGLHFPSREPTPRTELRSEEHTSELQSLMRISYAVFCLKKKKLKVR